MPDDQPTICVPDLLAEILADYDGRSDDFDEADLSFRLERALKECAALTEEQRKGGLAEVSTFQFDTEPFGPKSPWDTIDGDVIAYWKRRAKESSHPILRARYADVVWDLERAATGGKPSIQMAWMAVDSYVECGKQFTDRSEEERLNRALELALSIGDLCAHRSHPPWALSALRQPAEVATNTCSKPGPVARGGVDDPSR